MESEQKMSIFEQIMGIFYKPTEVYQDLVKFPRWLMIFIILVLISTIINVAVWQIPRSADAIKELIHEKTQDAARARDIKIPEDQMELQVTIAKYSSYFSAPFGILLISLVIAGLLYLVSYLLLDGKATFLMHFYVVLYSFIITIGNGLIYFLVIVIWGKADFAISLALFFPFLDEQHWLFPFLERMNLVYAWQMIVIGLGLKVINQWKSHRGIIAALVFYLIYIIIAGLLKPF
jgi:Yip1 domain